MQVKTEIKSMTRLFTKYTLLKYELIDITDLIM